MLTVSGLTEDMEGEFFDFQNPVFSETSGVIGDVTYYDEDFPGYGGVGGSPTAGHNPHPQVGTWRAGMWQDDWLGHFTSQPTGLMPPNSPIPGGATGHWREGYYVLTYNKGQIVPGFPLQNVTPGWYMISRNFTGANGGVPYALTAPYFPTAGYESNPQGIAFRNFGSIDFPLSPIDPTGYYRGYGDASTGYVGSFLLTTHKISGGNGTYTNMGEDDNGFFYYEQSTNPSWSCANQGGNWVILPRNRRTCQPAVRPGISARPRIRGRKTCMNKQACPTKKDDPDPDNWDLWFFESFDYTDTEVTVENDGGVAGDPHFEGFDKLFDFHGKADRCYQLYKSESLLVNCKMLTAYNCQDGGTFIDGIYIKSYRNGKEFEATFANCGTSDTSHVFVPLSGDLNKYLAKQPSMFLNEVRNNNWGNDFGVLIETDVGNIYLVHSTYLGQPHINFKFSPSEIENDATGIIGQTGNMKIRLPNELFEIADINSNDILTIITPEMYVPVII